MGKIKFIQKSRKECACSKCRQVIPVGSSYIKGVMFHAPPIIRCVKCGLKHYEVTTSSYVRTVGAVVEDWGSDYRAEDGVWEDIADVLDELKDELQSNLDNMPEQFQDGDVGTLLEERIDALDSVVDELRETHEMDDFLQEGYDDLDEARQAVVDKVKARYKDADYSAWYQEFWEKPDGEDEAEVAAAWRERTEEAISTFIDEALSGLEY